MQSKTKIKIGIYSSAILMMGVIGVAGSLSVIGEHFSGASQTAIMSIITIPCLVVIPVTILVGKLMNVFSKKHIALAGIFVFLVAGWAPAFMDSIVPILVVRGFMGVGIGIIQVVSVALIAENFEGAEREKVQGNATAAQMLGCAVMVFMGGWLGARAWNLGFYVHLLAVFSFIMVAICIPHVKPLQNKQAANSKLEGTKTGLTTATWVWCITMFVFFVGGQIYSNYLSFLVNEHKLGSAADAGMALAFFCLGGIIMGVFFGKLASITKKTTLAVGFLTLAASYIVIGYAGSLSMVFAGCLLCGLAFSVVMPCIYVASANSAAPAAAGFAISLATCAQNLGQFASPFVTAPVSGMLGKGLNTSLWAFNFGTGLLIAISVPALIWALKGQGRKTN